MSAPPPKVVAELLRQRAREHPGKPFLGCESTLLTFHEADAASERIAAGLASIGLAPGERVAVISANRLEVALLFFACAKAEVVDVPLNVFLKGEFLRYQLADCEPSAVVVDAAGLESLRPLLPGLPSVRRLVLLDGDASGLEVDAVAFSTLAECRDALPARAPTPATLLTILYTSGTTGMPKGCMLPNGWYVNGASVSSEMMEYGPEDVLFTCLPLFHAWAQGMMMGALVHRLPVTIDPIFSVGRLLERFIETGATVFTGVGAMGMAMLGSPVSDRDRAHRLRAALMIPFTPDQQAEFSQRFGAIVMAQMYGQTECGAIAYSRISEPRNLASIGRAAPTYRVRLVDEDDGDVTPGEVGEIVVRPTIPWALFLGYWRKPAETLEAWRNLWHHTGDYGRMDADGFISFVDRKKDALRRRGENVSSVELERAICAHPAVAEAAVHAIPSPMTEDDIKACLVLVPDAAVTPQELAEFFARSLPYFAIPRYVEVVDELPKNATMRVMKHMLRERGVTASTWDFDALGIAVNAKARR